MRFLYSKIKTYFVKIVSLFKYPIFVLSGGFISGCIVGELFMINNLELIGIMFLIPFIILLFTTKSRNTKLLIVFIIFFSFGLYRYSLFFTHNDDHIKYYNESEVSIIGDIVYDPDIRENNIKVTFDVSEIIVEDKNISTNGLVLVTLPRYPVFYYGDRLRLSGYLKTPESFDEFDYGDYLRTQNIFSVLNARSTEKIDEDNNLIRIISDFKFDLSKRIKKEIPEPHASLLLGILIGTKENMPPDFEEDLSITSTTHIIAVSGYNVTVLLAAIFSLAGFIPRRLAMALAGIILFLFLIIVGINNLPALRASVMGFALLLSLIVGKRGGIISFLPLSAAILMYINPLSFKSLSFQLSFVSTLGLIFYSDMFDNLLKGIPEFFRSELGPTLAATMTTLPIILYNFGRLSSISPLSNMIVLPFIPFVMLFSFLYSITIYFGSVISFPFKILSYFTLDFVVRLIKFFGSLEFTALDFEHISPVIVLTFICLLIILALEVKHDKQNSILYKR